MNGNKVARPNPLRALIDWSHDLLDEREQRLFRRLAPFTGGWTLESAEAVCADAGLDEAEIIELLKTRTEQDFTLYKPGTLQRRTERRQVQM